MIPEDQKNITTQWWSTGRHFTVISIWIVNKFAESHLVNIVRADPVQTKFARFIILTRKLERRKVVSK